MEDFECKGVWWLPSEPAVKFSGELKFNKVGGANLYVTDNSPTNIMRIQQDGIDIILGTSLTGEKITLYDCLSLGDRIFSHCVFLGHHFERPEELIFNNVS
ncbi:MAG TPA: hypothetical protein VJZ27_06435, partial [Aggregatilineales bacterium]|nr:hypothetical protein [Aggregatilineales bacterium]